jgi:2-oxoglutarate dehydrogenase E1 component
MQVVNATTPAQYFHLLRRQAMQDKKKPLIVMSPKSLLRHPMAVSNTQELASGGFMPLLSDEHVTDHAAIDRVVFCSGKVYYDLLKHQQEKGFRNVALVRVEQLYPFPDHDVNETLKRYPNAKSVVWCQEEPKNMGAWSFVAPRIFSELQPGQHLHFAGRAASASPATGSAKVHAVEQERLVIQAIEA